MKHNKLFKLNIIAASIVMGLSLSAIATDGDSSTSPADTGMTAPPSSGSSASPPPPPPSSPEMPGTAGDGSMDGATGGEGSTGGDDSATGTGAPVPEADSSASSEEGDTTPGESVPGDTTSPGMSETVDGETEPEVRVTEGDPEGAPRTEGSTGESVPSVPMAESPVPGSSSVPGGAGSMDGTSTEGDSSTSGGDSTSAEGMTDGDTSSATEVPGSTGGGGTDGGTSEGGMDSTDSTVDSSPSPGGEGGSVSESPEEVASSEPDASGTEGDMSESPRTEASTADSSTGSPETSVPGTTGMADGTSSADSGSGVPGSGGGSGSPGSGDSSTAGESTVVPKPETASGTGGDTPVVSGESAMVADMPATSPAEKPVDFDASKKELTSSETAYKKALEEFNNATSAGKVAAKTKLDAAASAYKTALGKVSSAGTSELTTAEKAFADKHKEGSTATEEEKQAARNALIDARKTVAVTLVASEASLISFSHEDATSKASALDEARSALETAEKALKDNTDAAKKSSLETAVTSAKTALSTAQKAADSAQSQLAKDKQKVGKNLNELASLIPFTDSTVPSATEGSTESVKSERAIFTDAYYAALATVATVPEAVDKQAQSPDAQITTHYLGNLRPDDFASTDIHGAARSILGEKDDEGKIIDVKRVVTSADLYTGTTEKPIQTTVLNLQAPALAPQTGENRLLVAGDNTTPLSVNARTFASKVFRSADGSVYFADTAKESTADTMQGSRDGAAVTLSGDLKLAMAKPDATSDQPEETTIRGADVLEVRNASISNKLDSSDLALPGSKTVLGINIVTETVDPLTSLGVNPELTKPADTANIKLTSVNLSVSGDGNRNSQTTAILLGGKNNHLQVAGSTIKAEKTLDGSAIQGEALNITGVNNLVEFTAGSTIEGGIVGNKSSTQADRGVVLLNGGSTLLGDVTFDGETAAGNNSGLLLTLAGGSVWTGAAGRNSPDIAITGGSVWNATSYDPTSASVDPNTGLASGINARSSVNSLTMDGTGTVNLIQHYGLSRVGNGFTGMKIATALTVDNDMIGTGRGVNTIKIGGYSPDGFRGGDLGLADNYKYGQIVVSKLASGGSYRLELESAGTEPVVINDRLALPESSLPDSMSLVLPYSFVSYSIQESRTPAGASEPVVTLSNADFISNTPAAELGVYQYEAIKLDDVEKNRSYIQFARNGKLTNSVATVASLAAAPSDVTALENESLTHRLNAVRHANNSGVWISYTGGKNRNAITAGPEYSLRTNGLHLGIDTFVRDNWLAGVAFTSAASQLSVMNSDGKLNSYGAQFYLSRSYDNGLFLDGVAQFNHFSNSAKARSLDGRQGTADYSVNGYGFGVTLGYVWQNAGLFAEPYLKASANSYDGARYSLSNGLLVDSGDYKSVTGEIGTHLGYDVSLSQALLRPYLKLALQNQFATGNTIKVNHIDINNSVSGAAFKLGLGTEVNLQQNLGGYLSFDYNKGSNIERPWQINAGISYNW